MARGFKQGIEYFSHDVDMMQDKKIKLIKAKHGLIGYAVYLRLLEELYKDTGYYLLADDNFNILFADDNNIDYNAYISILNDCINYELFNIKLYNAYTILTSIRIQNNYLLAITRRKSVTIIKQYLLINVNADIISLNVNINIINVSSGTQSKVKESKVKRKGKDITKPVGFDYTSLYEHYINAGLVDHRKYTDDMKAAIDRAVKIYGYTLEEMKQIIDRHKIIVDASEHLGQYKKQRRSLAVLFGTKMANGSTLLICSEYADDGATWLKYLDGGYKEVQGKKTNDKATGFEGEREFSQDDYDKFYDNDTL